jgi:hypothetical protein
LVQECEGSAHHHHHHKRRRMPSEDEIDDEEGEENPSDIALDFEPELVEDDRGPGEVGEHFLFTDQQEQGRTRREAPLEEDSCC